MGADEIDDILRQLPAAVDSNRIRDGDPPSLEEVVPALLTLSLDADALCTSTVLALSVSDSEATWAERRIAWQCCLFALLTVLSSSLTMR